MKTLLIALLLPLITLTSAHAVPFEGHKLLITGPSPLAIEAGQRVAEQGGNVIDVAVAVGLTLTVTTPYYAALGGGGFAVVKMQDQVETLDFRETAPAATNKEYFKDLPKDASITGGHAVGVPGFAAGLYALHQKYGKLKWDSLFTTALTLANQGFPVSGEWVRNGDHQKARFTAAGKAAFFKGDGQAYKPGERLKQPELARALVALKNHKLKGFYQGAVAEDIVKSVRDAGGTMTLEDFKNYKVRWLKPLVTDFEGYKVYLMPPPSSGGIIILQALKLIDAIQLKAKAPLSVDELHGLAEVESRTFRSRPLLGDPDFHKNPITFLSSPTYLADLAKTISYKKATILKPLADSDIKESTDTTHYSVMDNEGHAIALTVTLNNTYGSAVVSEKFHIALNDQMDDFTTKAGEANMYGLTQGQGNSVQGGKRPLSSMSPTLVEKDGKVVMSLGAPGGPRIINTVMQILYRVLAQGMNVDQAIQYPRVHHQFSPNTLFVEKRRLSPEIIDALKERGHSVEDTAGVGKGYAIFLRPDGVLEAGFDARGEGADGGI